VRRKSLKGQLSVRLQKCSDSPELSDTELLISAVSSLIHSTEQLHGKLGDRRDERIAALEALLNRCYEQHYVPTSDELDALHIPTTSIDGEVDARK
jgi:hypothetical protein